MYKRTGCTDNHRRHGERDKLTKELDDVIQDMLDDGTVAKITEKWMYADMTKLIQK